MNSSIDTKIRCVTKYVAFDLNERVRIKGDTIEGIITSIFFQRHAIEYRVRYLKDGVPTYNDYYFHELESLDFI